MIRLRENQDGTIVLTDGEWNRSRFLHNGNYLLWGMELKLLKQLANGAKFEKVAEYNEEELRIIYKYEKALKDQEFKMRMRLKGLEAEDFRGEGGTKLKDKKYNYLIGSINRTLDNYFNTPQKERIMSQSAHNTIVDIRRQIAMSQLTLEERMKMDERDSLDSYESEGGEQYDYYTIERDYDEGYMNARVPNLKTNRLFEPLYYNQYNMMRDMSDRISTAFHPNAEVREQSGYGTREKQRDAIFNGLKRWNEQMIEDLNGVKRSIDMELGDRKFEAETFEAKGYRNPYAFRKPKLVNTDKYEGHTKGSWDRLSEYCPVGQIDRSLIADAPMLLEEVKDGNRIKEYIYQFAQYPSVKNINLADLIAFIEEDDERFEAEEFGADESINPKDYIAISFLDQQGNGHPTTLLNTYDLRFGERGSTYFKALREALDKGVKRGDYDGYKIKRTTSKPLQDEDYVYERRYNDEYDYEVWLMGDKFFYGDSGIPVVKNKYTINEGEPKFADMVYLNVIPKEKTEQPMDGLGSLFGAETFEAKGIDTFTEPFAELRTGSILNKAILLGSLGAGAMIGLKLRK